MLVTSFDRNEWKKDQIKYFNEYLANFAKDSKKYNLILQGIKELEKF